jgi:hypothetical protein
MAAAAEAAVLNLITTHNRPFGVQGLVDNLQSAGIKKAAVAKAVDALTERGAITCKVGVRACVRVRAWAAGHGA